ncbi:sigma-70 family RNA polymerase sigma factor [Paenibacillus spiritus]|uniref:Sigma-70 family RNA polymerase sigma factor n=1 Tax=Paenibacillus spiritus TaxID=2496557 RepID=A0A5J5GHL0_9BACL|nr:sigma-70 family RNA polymerase sigma factor [Paenibacillus spiritus]KAA9007223.1 sigma-70 family RNA polymerase sigma factor [Paenibacillus spiritus]
MNIKSVRRSTDFNNEDSIKRYMETNNSELKELIFKNNIPLVQLLARRWKLRGSTTPVEELWSLGFLGLTKAFNTYRLDKGIKFNSYAGACIWREFKVAATSQTYQCRSKYKSVSMENQIRLRGNKQIAIADTIADDNQLPVTEMTIRNELIDKFHKIVDSQFTPIERKVSTKYFFEGKGYQEIGQDLNISRQAVHQAFIRGINKLKKEFESEI